MLRRSPASVEEALNEWRHVLKHLAYGTQPVDIFDRPARWRALHNAALRRRCLHYAADPERCSAPYNRGSRLIHHPLSAYPIP